MGAADAGLAEPAGAPGKPEAGAAADAGHGAAGHLPATQNQPTGAGSALGHAHGAHLGNVGLEGNVSYLANLTGSSARLRFSTVLGISRKMSCTDIEAVISICA